MENCLLEGIQQLRIAAALQIHANFYYSNYTLVNVLLEDNHAEKGGGGYASTVIKPWTTNVSIAL